MFNGTKLIVGLDPVSRVFVMKDRGLRWRQKDLLDADRGSLEPAWVLPPTSSSFAPFLHVGSPYLDPLTFFPTTKDVSRSRVPTWRNRSNKSVQVQSALARVIDAESAR